MIFPSFSSFVRWWTRLMLAAWCRCSGVSCRRGSRQVFQSLTGEELQQPQSYFIWLSAAHLITVMLWKQYRLFSRPYKRSWRAPWRRTASLLRPWWQPGSVVPFGLGGWCSVGSWSQHPEPRGHDLQGKPERFTSLGGIKWCPLVWSRIIVLFKYNFYKH